MCIKDVTQGTQSKGPQGQREDDALEMHNAAVELEGLGDGCGAALANVAAGQTGRASGEVCTKDVTQGNQSEGPLR